MSIDLIRTADSSSPFDQIRSTRSDGSDFWLARELMLLLGYSKWENFERCVIEARRAAEITAAQDQFADVRKMVQIGSGATREVTDVQMTRYGAYMVAMSCDGSKPEVAAAKTYFAVRTREAETRPVFDPASLTRAEILEMALDSERERVALEARIAELEPSANSWNHLAAADGDYDVSDAAKILSRAPSINIGRQRLFQYMSDQGWIYRHYGDGHWRAYQAQVNNGRLVERPGREYRNPVTLELSLGDPMVRIRPKGLSDLQSLLTAPQRLPLAAELPALHQVNGFHEEGVK